MTISIGIIIKWVISFISGLTLGGALMRAKRDKDYLNIFGLIFIFIILNYFMYWAS